MAVQGNTQNGGGMTYLPGAPGAILATIARGEDFNLMLTCYGLERFLYRLSRVPGQACQTRTALL
jgi:hypothetical protein